MKFIDWIANTFINTFGITQPKPGQLRTASWFIVGLLVAVVVLVTAVGLTLHGVLSH